MNFEKLVSLLSFEEEEKKILLNAEKEIMGKYPEEYEKIIASYHVGKKENAAAIKESAEIMGIHSYVVSLWFFLRYSVEYALPKYEALGIPEKIFVETMSNSVQYSVTTKLKTGVFGIITDIYVHAQRHLFELNAFRIGNLNFERIKFGYDLVTKDCTIPAGEVIISVHIPRGTDFSDELCEKSYREAKEFYKKYFGIDNGVFHCHSWMLHPWLSEDISPESKIVKFGTKFSLCRADNSLAPNEYLFPKQFEEGDTNFASYPENTSMQRAAKRRLIEGLPYGCAEGIRFL